jgi:outer membrane lipoprotein SlyB
MRIATIAGALVALTLIVEPAMAASLSSKDRARVSRAAPRDRDDVRYCLIKRKKDGGKGAVIGAAGGAGVGLIAGGGVGETLLGAGAGAVAGHLIGKGNAGGDACDRVLRRNP